ncbi:hypothetical protein ACNKHU_16065 [Shigella flexneri]
MPIKPLVAGRAIPSAGCTGGFGYWLSRWKRHRRHDPALWVPGIPIWLFSLVITLALTGSNLLSVKNYGEFEFWLALCKVIAILALFSLVQSQLAVFTRMPK